MEKIWGLYNSYSDPDYFIEDEFILWEKISYLETFVKDFEGNTNLRYNYEFLIYSTRKFGVEFDEEPSETRHVKKSESYYRWFKFWDNHFKNMDRYYYFLFLDDRARKKDVSKYMPDGSWKDEPKEKLR